MFYIVCVFSFVNFLIVSTKKLQKSCIRSNNMKAT